MRPWQAAIQTAGCELARLALGMHSASSSPAAACRAEPVESLEPAFQSSTHALACSLVCIQGDGTAVCLQDEPRAFTLSVHSASNFPSRKQQSDLDVPLPDGVGDDEYMRWAPVRPGRWPNKT